MAMAGGDKRGAGGNSAHKLVKRMQFVGVPAQRDGTSIAVEPIGAGGIHLIIAAEKGVVFLNAMGNAGIQHTQITAEIPRPNKGFHPHLAAEGDKAFLFLIGDIFIVKWIHRNEQTPYPNRQKLPKQL